MTWRHYVFFTGLVGAGLVASLLMIAGDTERALMRFRDKDFDAALREYQARLADGDRSVAVVMPLCQLYLQFGNVEAAVSLMERFVRDNPSDVPARRTLAKYYRYSQREDRYLEMLETIVRTDPSEDTLRQLSDIYNFQEQFDKQIAVLRQLIRLHHGQPGDLIDLAHLQASQDRLADAVATLEQFHSSYPDKASPDTVQFLISLLLDSGHADRALRRAEAWLSTCRNADVATRFASLVNFKGHPREAWSLLETFQDAASTNADVLAELTQLEIINGKQARALSRLDRLNAADRLPPSALDTYLDLLLTGRRAADAFDVAAHHDLSGLPSWLLVNLADAALSGDRSDFAEHLRDSLGERFLDDDPVLGARLALARQDRAGAEIWAGNAVVRELSHQDRLGLAQVYVALHRRDDAIALLRPLSTDPEAPDSAAVDLANLYLEGDPAGAGLRVIESIRLRRRSPEIDGRWALLAAKAGREDAVVRWLRLTPAAQIPDNLLEDLYFVASDTNEGALVLMTAEQLYARRGGRPQRLQLASALLATGRPEDALPHFRALMPGDMDVESEYVEALTGALGKGFAVRDELRRFWAARLSGTGLGEATREDIIHALLSIDAYDAALPALVQLARTRGDSWLFAYADAAVAAGRIKELATFLETEIDRADLTESARATRLQLLREHAGDERALPYLRRFADAEGGDGALAYETALEGLGRRTDLVAFWQARTSRRDVSAEEKRGIAFRSLEAGQKTLAESIFLALAASEPPDGPDVMEVLFLWGPRPHTRALGWLEARARASSGREKGLWMQHLINAGAPRRAADAAQGEFSDAYLQALLAAGDGETLSRVIADRLPLVSDPGTLHRLAKAALELGQTAAMRSVYQKMLTIAPDDPEALRQVGAIDYVESRFPEARQRLGRYLANGGSDYESHFYFGELLSRDRDHAAARVQFERALAQIDRTGHVTFHMRTVRALALHRLGQVTESFAEFAALLREQPGNEHLRADYAAALLESGRYDDARHILSTS